jgi:hypothetical protein
MATLAKTSVPLTKNTGSTAAMGWYDRLMAEVSFNYFFVISFIITAGSCLGGVAAMFILSNNAPIWQLCINIYVTMGCNVACIGQAPPKWVINIFGISVLANIVLLLANVL